MKCSINCQLFVPFLNPRKKCGIVCPFKYTFVVIFKYFMTIVMRSLCFNAVLSETYWIEWMPECLDWAWYCKRAQFNRAPTAYGVIVIKCVKVFVSQVIEQKTRNVEVQLHANLLLWVSWGLCLLSGVRELAWPSFHFSRVLLKRTLAFLFI